MMLKETFLHLPTNRCYLEAPVPNARRVRNVQDMATYLKQGKI